LALTSRDLRRLSVAQVVDAERLQHLVAARLPLGRAKRSEPVSDVLLGGQVGKQRQILRHVTDAPFPGGDVPFLFRVVKVLAANGNSPIVRIGEPRNTIEQCGFSRARSAKKNRETGERTEVDIQIETALGIRKAFTDADFEIGRDWLWC